MIEWFQHQKGTGVSDHENEKQYDRKRKVNETFLCVFLYSAESRRDEYKTTRQAYIKNRTSQT